jgi:hypothetical protein
MAVVKTYRELEAWQAGIDLVEVVYALTRTFPRDELFGITAQARRAAKYMPSVGIEHALLLVARTGQLLNGLRRSLEARPPR